MKKIFLTLCMGVISVLFLPASVFSQNIPVSGKITDNTNAPLEGATVKVKGSTISTITGSQGDFQLNVPSSNSVLVISYVGFVEQEFPLGGKTSISISLTPEANALQDVVVIGYATIKKKDVTGAVGGIGEKDIKSRPVDNAVQAMQGKVAGVDISSNERPGTIGNISIRGIRSLTASNSPLFVVDGIPLITGGIDNLNPQDIQSIDILKDASATAIYGSRGANGVVIITTKQAKSGKVTLGLNNSVTLNTLEDNMEMFNATEFITFRRWAYYYAGLNPTTGVSAYPRGDQPDINFDKTYFFATADPYAWANVEKGWASGTWDPSKVSTTDWMGLVKQQSITSDNLLSISGGTDKIRAYGSFGYLNNKGTIKGQSFGRYTARANVDIDPTKWFSLGLNINASYGKQQYGQSGIGVSTVGSPRGGLYESARSIFPYAVPYDNDGNRILFPGADNAIKTVIDEWKYNIDERVTFRAFGSIYAQVDVGQILPVLKGLRYRVNFGPDLSYYRDGVYIDKLSVANGGSSSYASLTKRNDYSYTLDHLIYYDRAVGDHNFSVTLLHSQTKYTQETSNITGNGVPFTSQLWNNLSSGTVTGSLSASSGLTEQQLLSYMGRLNYSFKDKYLLTVSARQDGSSVLAEGHKFAWFPSAALAWRISKENFMNAAWVNDLKLRVGVGVTGNSAVLAYATQGGVTSLFYPFLASNATGSIPNTTLANQNVGWEKTTQYNIGVDFSLFKRRLYGSVDVYKSSTTDLLLQATIPSVTGYINSFANVGKTGNRGIDITLTSVNIQQNNLTWSTTLNAAWQKEEIVELVNGKQADINNGWFPGNPVNVIYGYKALGLWQEKDAAVYALFNQNGNAFYPGNVRVADLNGDNKIDPNNDRTIIGWTTPRWVVGMTNEVSYKNWAFSIFLYGRLNYLYNQGGEAEVARTVSRKINYYTENNKNSDYQKPIFNAGGAAGDAYFGALGYVKGSFIKIRNVSLSYNLDHRILGDNGISNLRVYFQVQNLGMLYSPTKFLDMDVLGPTWNRGITLGINATF